MRHFDEGDVEMAGVVGRNSRGLGGDKIGKHHVFGDDDEDGDTNYDNSFEYDNSGGFQSEVPAGNFMATNENHANSSGGNKVLDASEAGGGEVGAE
jgi:hypothetical protein